MLIRILLILFALALFRFLVRLAKTLLHSTRGPKIHSRRSAGQTERPTKDQQVVDVEFTEEKSTDKHPEETE